MSLQAALERFCDKLGTGHSGPLGEVVQGCALVRGEVQRQLDRVPIAGSTPTAGAAEERIIVLSGLFTAGKA